MSDLRIDQLDPHIALASDDLLHLYQDDGVDRKATLDDHFAWLKAQPTFAPSLDVGTFYVDAVAGSDSADGRTLATAKQNVGSLLQSLPTGSIAIILLRHGQTHTLKQNVDLYGCTITFNSDDGLNHTADTTFLNDWTGPYPSLLGLYATTIFLYNINIQTGAAGGNTILSSRGFLQAQSGGSCSIALVSTRVTLVDMPLISSTGNGFGVCLGISTVDIEVASIAAGARPYLVDDVSSNIELNAQLVTLGVGVTWPSLFSHLYYGADHSPNNLIHNLGSAFDV